tara:strand:- start:12067 stop:12375 length:309 start_codon:yes stop_codon:yes gene_type:complete
MKVIIESPYRFNVERNTLYAQKALLDSLNRNESPLAFHLFYTQVLNDLDEKERFQGIMASFQWHKVADLLAVYTDYGVSYGMKLAINLAKKNKLKIEERAIL